MSKAPLLPGTANGSSLARHVYSIIQGVITVVMIGVGAGVIDLRERMARIEAKADERARTLAEQRELNLSFQSQVNLLQREINSVVLAAAHVATATANAAAAAAAAAAADDRRRK